MTPDPLRNTVGDMGRDDCGSRWIDGWPKVGPVEPAEGPIGL